MHIGLKTGGVIGVNPLEDAAKMADCQYARCSSEPILSTIKLLLYALNRDGPFLYIEARSQILWSSNPKAYKLLVRQTS
jgi:hypothetical protein